VLVLDKAPERLLRHPQAVSTMTPRKDGPRTEAGRRLYDDVRIHNVAQRVRADDQHAKWLKTILAIEAEAAIAAAENHVCEAATGPHYPGAPGGVHDHGPHQGPGITCPEYLIGHCRTELEEPSLDELWAAVAASLAIAEEHKMAIYRSGDGVPGPEALAGIQKHIEAGLAARVMYERLRDSQP
jgi:hypothetical protein